MFMRKKSESEMLEMGKERIMDNLEDPEQNSFPFHSP